MSITRPRLFLVVGRCRGTVVVTVRGELDAMNSERLLELVIDLVDGQGNLDVVLDLGGLRRVDPCGVDVLRDAIGRGERRGGRLRLGRPADAVLEVLLAADLAPFVIPPHDPASGFAGPGSAVN